MDRPREELKSFFFFFFNSQAKILYLGQVLWHMHVILACKRQRQLDCYKSEASLVYIVISRLARDKEQDLVSRS